LFILDVATKSQKDHKLSLAQPIRVAKKIANKKIEGSPLPLIIILPRNGQSSREKF
jgi:hypothetical protein